MKKIQTVYKVVRRIGVSGSFSSARCGEALYRVGQPATPTFANSKLFCFDSLENAQRFAMRHERIFLAQATNVTRAKLTCHFIYQIADFWKAKSKKQKVKGLYGSDRPLEGTLFADTITLIREVS